MKKEIMEIIESLNESPEIAYIKEMKKAEEKNDAIQTKIVDLKNGSKRYIVKVGETYRIEYSSKLNCTHAVIGRDSKNGEMKAYGFHSTLEIAQKKMKKFINSVHEIFIVELV